MDGDDARKEKDFAWLSLPPELSFGRTTLVH